MVTSGLFLRITQSTFFGTALNNKGVIYTGNMLYNPDLKINQRGKTVYSEAGYCADRWKLTDGFKLTLNGSSAILAPVREVMTGVTALYQDICSETGCNIVSGKEISMSAYAASVNGFSLHLKILDATMTTELLDTKLIKESDGVYRGKAVIPDNGVVVRAAVCAESGADISDSMTIELISVVYGQATGFISPDHEEELRRCQRFYWDSGKGVYGAPGAYSLTPGNQVSTGDGYRSGFVNIRFPCKMRAVPSIFIVAYDGTKESVSDWAGGTLLCSGVIVNPATLNDSGFTDIKIPGSSALSVAGFHVIADAEF